MLYRYFDKQARDRARRNKRLLKSLNNNNSILMIQQNNFLFDKSNNVVKSKYTAPIEKLNIKNKV